MYVEGNNPLEMRKSVLIYEVKDFRDSKQYLPLNTTLVCLINHVNSAHSQAVWWCDSSWPEIFHAHEQESSSSTLALESVQSLMVNLMIALTSVQSVRNNFYPVIFVISFTLYSWLSYWRLVMLWLFCCQCGDLSQISRFLMLAHSGLSLLATSLDAHTPQQRCSTQ